MPSKRRGGEGCHGKHSDDPPLGGAAATVGLEAEYAPSIHVGQTAVRASSMRPLTMIGRTPAMLRLLLYQDHADDDAVALPRVHVDRVFDPRPAPGGESVPQEIEHSMAETGRSASLRNLKPIPRSGTLSSLATTSTSIWSPGGSVPAAPLDDPQLGDLPGRRDQLARHDIPSTRQGISDEYAPHMARVLRTTLLILSTGCSGSGIIVEVREQCRGKVAT